MGVEITRFDVRQASEEEITGYFEVEAASQELDRPDLPALTREVFVTRLHVHMRRVNEQLGFTTARVMVAVKAHVDELGSAVDD